MNEDNDIHGERRERHPQLSAAAWVWLTQTPARAVGTEPVIAIVEELLDILTARPYPDEEKLASLRRAIGLLNAFATGKKPARL